MILHPYRRIVLNNSNNFVMGSKYFLQKPSITFPTIHKTIPVLFQTQRPIFSVFASKPISPNRGTSSFSYRPQRIPPPVSGVMLEDPKEEIMESEHEMALKQKLSQIGIDIGSCGPGQYNGLLCPMCKGGSSNEKSLSLFITQDGHAATWTCFRAKCGWRGGTRAFADVRTAYADMKRIGKVNKKYRQITEESLGLEPLCDVVRKAVAHKQVRINENFSSKPSSVCGDTTSVPKASTKKVQGGFGRGLGRKIVNARGTPFVSDTYDSSSQVPPSSSHKRQYSSTLFAAANGGNKRRTTGFGVFSDPTTGSQVLNPGTQVRGLYLGHQI